MNPLSSMTDTSLKAIKETEKYVSKSEAYYKLKIFQQLTFVLSTLSKTLVIGSLVFISFVFIIIASVILLSHFLGSFVYGCLLISLFIGIIALVLFLNRKHIDKVVIKKVSKTYFH